MATRMLTTILPALAMLWSAGVHAADTLADMGIEVDPALIAYGIDPGVPHPTVYQPWQPHRIQQFVQAPQIGPVVFIGDSIIAFMPTGLLPPGSVNLAVSGHITSQILADVPHIPANARTVYVEGGINDMLNLIPGQIVPDYAKIIAGIPKGAQVKVIGILPVNEAQLATNRDFAKYVDNAKIAAINAQIAPLCTGRCSTVPAPTGVATVDGIHPSPAGQAVLAKALR